MRIISIWGHCRIICNEDMRTHLNPIWAASSCFSEQEREREGEEKATITQSKSPWLPISSSTHFLVLVPNCLDTFFWTRFVNMSNHWKFWKGQFCLARFTVEREKWHLCRSTPLVKALTQHSLSSLVKWEIVTNPVVVVYSHSSLYLERKPLWWCFGVNAKLQNWDPTNTSSTKK